MLDSQPQKNSLNVDVIIAGSYVLDAEQPVLINDISIEPGEQVLVTRGQNQIVFARGQTVVHLRLDVTEPEFSEPVSPLFTGFGRK